MQTKLKTVANGGKTRYNYPTGGICTPEEITRETLSSIRSPAGAVRLHGRRRELTVSVNVLEERGGEPCLRELRLLRASAAACDPAAQ